MRIKKNKVIDKSYGKHIMIILIVKVFLFTGIWYFFFRDPIELNDKQAFQSNFFRDNNQKK